MSAQYGNPQFDLQYLANPTTAYEDGGESGPVFLGRGPLTFSSAPMVSPFIVEPVKTRSQSSDSLTLHHLWPHYFTFGMLAFCGASIVAGMHLAQDPTVDRWVGGGYGYVPMLIPGYLAVCHLVHLRAGLPKMVPVILSTIVPCLLIFLCGNFHLAATGIVASMLSSRDCTTFATKQDVHKSWVLAATLYETCVNRTAGEHSISFEDGLKLYRLQECKEYYASYYLDGDPYYDHRLNWEYLRRMEETDSCSGWCWQSRPLWSFAEVKDSCSATAGATLASKVKPVAEKMVGIATVGFCLSIAMVVWMGNQMRKEGYEWERF